MLISKHPFFLLQEEKGVEGRIREDKEKRDIEAAIIYVKES